MQEVKKIFLASVTVFSMFFGAGNLIYPLFIGANSNSSYLMGIFGLFITAIIIPLIGLISIVVHHGDVDRFFATLGKNVSTILIILILAIIGPLGAIPRCTIVTFSGIKIFFPYMNEILFDLFIYIFISICIYKKNKIVEIVGKWLSPIFLFSITIIIFFAIKVDYISSNATQINNDAFLFALMEGYHTMDLCAAFFFGKIIFDYFQNSFKNKEEVFVRNSIISCVAGVSLLLIVYIAFIFIGAKYSDYLSQVSKSDILVQLSVQVLGKYAAIFSGLATIFACITTAIALMGLVTDWIFDRLKFKRVYIIIFVACLSFLFTLLGFTIITQILAEILYYMYPALIALSIGNIIYYLFPKFNFIKQIFISTLMINLLVKFL